MGLRDRLPIQTEPETVERAPRWERWKRQAWMVTSTLIAFFAACGLAWTATYWLPGIPLTGWPGIAAAVATIGVAFVIDMHLFAWGFERFDLVAPWQFREVDDG